MKVTSQKCIKQDWSLLKHLCEIPAPSGHEKPLSDFLRQWIKKEKKKWKVQPTIVAAIFAHMDSIGFTVRYFNQLLSIGSPDADMGTKLVGRDSLGPIECELEFDKEDHAFYKFGRPIDRGTCLTYKVNFRKTKDYIETAYLDNRLGIYNALQVASTLKDGVIVFSCWEARQRSCHFFARQKYSTQGVCR